jgi:hypothetical protein
MIKESGKFNALLLNLRLLFTLLTRDTNELNINIYNA